MSYKLALPSASAYWHCCLVPSCVLGSSGDLRQVLMPVGHSQRFWIKWSVMLLRHQILKASCLKCCPWTSCVHITWEPFRNTGWLSLVVQWLRLSAPNEGTLDLIPVQGTSVWKPQLKILHTATRILRATTKTQHSQINFFFFLKKYWKSHPISRLTENQNLHCHKTPHELVAYENWKIWKTLSQSILREPTLESPEVLISSV